MGVAAAAFSPEDQAKLSSLNQRIDELDRAGKYRDAIPIAEEFLKFVERLAGGNDRSETDFACDKLGDLYLHNGDYAKAQLLYQRSLTIREKAIGSENQFYAMGLNKMALLYRTMGQDAKAEPLFQRALKINEKALGPNHPYTAAALNNLGQLYDSMGEYAKAEPLLRRALKLSETFGPNDSHTATVLTSLALLYRSTGEYAKAEPLLQRALRIREQTFGPNHFETALGLNNLAQVYDSMGDYAKAEPLLRRALEIDEKALGPDHPDTAKGLNNLAMLYSSMGDYAKAEPLLQRALKIKEKAFGPSHPDIALAANNLAQVYEHVGDYVKAVLLYRRALDINMKTLGPGHPDTVKSLNNWGMMGSLMGAHAEAVPFLESALQEFEKTLGAQHPDTAKALNNLASLYGSMGDYAKAEPLYQRALIIEEKALGSEHADTAATLNNLAGLYTSMGDYLRAEALYQRALKICEKTLGPEHPNTASILNNLAFLKIDLGKTEEAAPLVAQARRANEKHLSNILSFTSEQQRLAFQTTTNPYALAATLGNVHELAQTVLRQKGAVLDSLLEDRLVAEASSDPKQREIIERLRAGKRRLLALMLEVPKDLSEAAQKRRAAEKEKLSTEVEQLETGFARQVAGLGKARRALSVTVAQVQSVLPKQGILAELVRYNHYLGKSKWELRYGAVVIAPIGDSKWVPLGNAAEIERNVKLYQKSTRGQTDEATLSIVLKKLQEQIWVPIEKALPAGTTTVIVSPDAELSFVSFATLLTPDDRFVGERYSIHYVASGRDLLRETKPAEAPKTLLRIFANPNFSLSNARKPGEKTNQVVLRSVEMRDLQHISFPNLPGTARESAALEARAKKSGWPAQANLGANATETELQKVKSPRILHLATHGFFLPEFDLGPPLKNLSGTTPGTPKGKLVNPMHRSGLAVAGAQTTLEAWARGDVPPTENDGIVTAEEVGGLKLDGTWLVVLSACDTGGGEARAGEGVMGLRRGFVQAGTQNLLITLWPISDETTVQIMLDFYDAAFNTGHAPQALANTQRDWLVKLRKERGLLAAVQLAGPFIMSSQGKP